MAVSFWMWTWVTAAFSSAAAQSPSYHLHTSLKTFDQALEACSPGLLTTLTTHPEANTILNLISGSGPPPTNESTFWVGLRKAKDECMVPTLPLRGFKWTADGSEATQVSRWAEEPEHTCTTVRCAALKVQVQGTAMTGWGLVSVSCKKKSQFICKLKDSQTVESPKPTEPHPEPTPAEPDPRRSKPTSDTPNPETSLGRSHHGSEQEGGSGSCRRPSRPVARSLILDPEDPSRIQVECWGPGVLVEVRCSGRPARWRLQDGGVANFSSICVQCDDGFLRSSSGTCEDIDECVQSGAPCRNTCLNTPGSYRCVCTDDSGNVASEDSPSCKDAVRAPDRSWASGLLIPLLVAVVALVVLVVLVALVIKCCMMRRSKRRAAKEAEKMSMGSKDEKKSAT